MESVKSLMNCIGVDTSGNVSVLGHLFGFIRRRVPNDDDGNGVSSQVSLLDQAVALQGRHIHINAIRVGWDTLPTANAECNSFDHCLEKLDYAIYRLRIIYTQVNIGLGRVAHYQIPAAGARGFDDIGGTDEAGDLWREWTVTENNGIDAFFVRSISGNLLGLSPTGACTAGGNPRKPAKRDGLMAGDATRSFDQLARTFAHEVGHFLSLPHNHDDDDCPNSQAGCNNLMAQTGCANTCGNGVRIAVTLGGGQGDDMRSRCYVRDGC